MKTIFTFVMLLTSFVAAYGMEEFTHRLATQDDRAQLLELVNTQVIKDSDKVVVLPEKFREGSLQSAIEKQRLFVTEDNQSQIIGYKKLFVLEGQEAQEVLRDELRCIDVPSVHAGEYFGDAHENYKELSAPVVHTYEPSSIYIYTGGDFTSSEYRGKGLNVALTNAALKSIKKRVVKKAHAAHALDRLAVVYGLTQANAGEGEHAKDRTPSIMKSVAPFMREIRKELRLNQSDPINFSRFFAYKPSFAPDAQECCPLSDDQSIPGYGCVISTYLLDTFVLDEQ